MEKQRINALKRYHRLKNDPNYMKPILARNLRHYHENIKTDPIAMDKRRNRIRGYQQKKRAKLQEVRKKLQALLEAKCIDCGITDYRLLDFDHIDPMTKTMNISQKLHLPWEQLVEEVMKCQLRCPNCHRLKTMGKHESDYRIRKFRNPKKQSAF